MSRRHSLPDKVNLFTVILADANLPATSKVIAGWLLFHHHNTVTGICTPSNRTIGKAIGIRPENVSRHIGTLVKSEYLFVRRRVGTSNSYAFNWPKGAKAAVSAMRKALKKAESGVGDMMKTTGSIDENVKPPCSTRHDHNDGNVNLILELKTGTEDGNLTLPGESEAPLLLDPWKDDVPGGIGTGVPGASEEGVLARFCSIYPLVISKEQLSAVRSALHRSLAIANGEAILDGAMRYANECSGREANFIADPVNWLNGRRWCSKDKTKAEIVILGPDGKSLTSAYQKRPRSRSQQILQWTPARKNPFSLQ